MLAFSLNWYGGAMLHQWLKQSSTAVMPKFDGFMKCRIRPLMGACRTYLAPTPTTTPKATGQNRSLA